MDEKGEGGRSKENQLLALLCQPYIELAPSWATKQRLTDTTTTGTTTTIPLSFSPASHQNIWETELGVQRRRLPRHLSQPLLRLLDAHNTVSSINSLSSLTRVLIRMNEMEKEGGTTTMSSGSSSITTTCLRHPLT
jgi:hypothetical protein